MTLLTLGDRSAAFQSLGHGARLKSDLNRLADQLSSGKAADVASHLSGRTGALAALDRDVERIDGFLARGSVLGLTLDRQQLALDAMSATLEDAGARMVGLQPTSSEAELTAAEGAGAAAFTSAIERLNGFSGGRALFSGVATDRVPLASPDTILTALESHVAGLSSAEDIASAVKAWFADDTGGFSSVAYLGATGAAARQAISDTQSITATARADVPAMRDALAASAMAALSDRMSDSLSRPVRANLLQGAGTAAFGGAQALHRLAASLGDDQALIDKERVRQGASRTVYATARNDLVNIDPFETASRLQDTQQSLELHFAATARLSRLSLANYL